MIRFLLLVNYDGGVVDTPMLEWERSPGITGWTPYEGICSRCSGI
jgi:hypothetical protein